MGTLSLIAFILALALLGAAALGLRRIVAAQRQLPAPPAPASTASPTLVEVAAPYRLVRSRHGWMLVNHNDFYLGQAILRYGECCEVEVQFLLKFISLCPGLVIEVGANIGTHTVPMAIALAKQARRLIAFEPQPRIFQNLCANVALNALPNVVAWPYACAEKATDLHFELPDYAVEGNFGGVAMSEEALADGQTVPCVTIDSVIAAEGVGLMKIDVEGFELQVLMGAEAVIDRSRPILYVENDRIDKSSALIEWLWSKQYRLWWHAPPLFNPDNFFANSDDCYRNVVSINMLCLPRESTIPIDNLTEVVDNRHPLEGRA